MAGAGAKLKSKGKMMTNWKTTAAGILSALIGTSGPATAFIGALQAMKTTPNYNLTIAGAVLTLVFSIARVWVGLLQNDAPPNPPDVSATSMTGTAHNLASSRKFPAWALIAVLLQGTLIVGGSATVLTLTGCPLSVTQAENEVNVLIQEATGIIAVADPSASWLADFEKATALLKVDEANWVKGGAVQDVINVLNDLEQVTALISPLVPYASLVGILVAGIDAALALLLPAPAGAAPAAMSAHVATAPNPFKGLATVKSGADSKTQWNIIVKQRPELARAAI
jgi:hypothetical protein